MTIKQVMRRRRFSVQRKPPPGYHSFQSHSVARDDNKLGVNKSDPCFGVFLSFDFVTSLATGPFNHSQSIGVPKV